MRYKLAVTVVILALIAGCAKVPQEAVDEANGALNEARLSGAEVFAPGSFAEAERVSAALAEELALQDGRSTLRKSYGKAEDLAAQLKVLATDALEYATAAKHELVAGLEVESAALTGALEETRASFERAKSKRGVRLDEESIASQIDRVSSLLKAAEADITADRLSIASSRLQEASFILESAESDIETALFTPSKR